MIVSELIKFGSLYLKRENIKSYALDSEILLSNVLKKSREEILIEFDKQIDFETEKKFKRLIKRRSAKEPIAYILKHKEFWSKKFQINHNILIPRPETELFI